METKQEVKKYTPLPTLRLFHESGAAVRAIVGPVGSGKTTAAAWELCYYLPLFLFKRHGIKKTRWVVLRNTYVELIDTTQRTLFDWFDWGSYEKQAKVYILRYPEKDIEVEILFRSCDRPEDVKKFKSLEITGYWIDESIEVDDDIKKMLKNRIGRFPRKSPVRFGIETTNPPDVEHPTYSDFTWMTDVPGPISEKKPLEGHEGFWQPAGENLQNLRPGYYDDLRKDYIDSPDWVAQYIDGKPGIVVQGKLVYNNFKRKYHVAEGPLIWNGSPLYMGWDNSGNIPAAVLLQTPGPMIAQVLREFVTDKMNIVDFGKWVMTMIARDFPGAVIEEHWGDPAGENKYSTREGNFTSNAELMKQECGIEVKPSQQNIRTRIEAVDQQLARIDGLLIDPSCVRLINGFIGGYCYPKNSAIVGEFKENIIKNKYSHPHDALQYVMAMLYKPLKREDLTSPLRRHISKRNDYAEYDPLGRTG